jgi:hypothetical protein
MAINYLMVEDCRSTPVQWKQAHHLIVPLPWDSIPVCHRPENHANLVSRTLSRSGQLNDKTGRVFPTYQRCPFDRVDFVYFLDPVQT